MAGASRAPRHRRERKAGFAKIKKKAASLGRKKPAKPKKKPKKKR